MDEYTQKKILAAQELVAKKKAAKAAKEPTILLQSIPITEKGSFVLGTKPGPKIVKAVLYICGREISTIRPETCDTITTPAGSIIQLPFLGTDTPIHNWGNNFYNIEVRFHFDEERGIPSLVQGEVPMPGWNGVEYAEDVVVTNDAGDNIPVTIVYRSDTVGLRRIEH